jgi:hypothetical protein
MAGMIFFNKHNWGASSWLTFYVMEHLASRIGDPATQNQISELVDNNIPMLDLRDPDKAPLVNLIVEDLPKHMPVLKDQTYQPELVALINELVDYAKEQQEQNHNSRN